MAGGDKRPDDADGGIPSSDSDLARRFDTLSRALDVERGERSRETEPRRSDASGYALAVRMGSEFVAGVVVGAALGWGLDRVAGTSPWGLIVLLLLGFAAGVLNVLRSAGRITSASGDPDAKR